VNRVHEGESIGIFVSLQCSFVQEAANGEVRHQQTVKLLLHEFRSLASQHDLCASQMGLQLIQGCLDLPRS
jgi:hypothetical protein